MIRIECLSKERLVGLENLFKDLFGLVDVLELVGVKLPDTVKKVEAFLQRSDVQEALLTTGLTVALVTIGGTLCLVIGGAISAICPFAPAFLVAGAAGAMAMLTILAMVHFGEAFE